MSEATLAVSAHTLSMNDLVYPKEKTLGMITLVLGLLAWAGLIVGTVGVALIGLAVGFVLYLFLQSTLIAYIKGNGVELTHEQYPDLYEQFAFCCDRLEIHDRPQAYILNGNGGLNAFATKFLGTQYVVLLSDVVDAMAHHPDGVRFYLGHELGHLRRKHLTGHLFRWPILWLPLLGAAYSRSRESTCDRHGLACCSTPENAARSLSALSAGAIRWQDLDMKAYLKQIHHTTGFWMSFHELTAGYPWLTKRAARVIDHNAELPSRNGFAYLLAAFIPYAGRLGGGFGLLMLIYVVGLLAAIAIPAYQDYTVKAKLTSTIQQSEVVRDTLGKYYLSYQKVPATLASARVADELPNGTVVHMDNNTMVLTLTTAHGDLIYAPSRGANGEIIWNCTNGKGLKATQLPPVCQASPNR
jgi:Zn-dependent protease with chaperone function/Tfp pilus assembly major pilin PilA